MTKLENMEKLVKNLFDEDQTAFEAVTFEGRNHAKAREIHQEYPYDKETNTNFILERQNCLQPQRFC